MAKGPSEKEVLRDASGESARGNIGRLQHDLPSFSTTPWSGRKIDQNLTRIADVDATDKQGMSTYKAGKILSTLGLTRLHTKDEKDA